MKNSIGQLTLARRAADRDAVTRANPLELERARASDRARYVLVSGDSVAVKGGGLITFAVTELANIGSVESYYLGVDNGLAYFAVDARELLTDEEWSETLAGLQFESVRESAQEFSELDTGLAVTAVALLTWHQDSKFCTQDGTPTTLIDSGWEQECERGHRIFPRTDPAVIMAIRDGKDRLLLGRNRSWPEGRYSTLAGFVEAGEPLEAAVRREVFEEAGVDVGRIEYFGSQPWPFPRSLMVAYRGWTAAPEPEIQVDGVEILEAFFISREDFARRVRSGDMLLPGISSVARALIEDWYGAALDDIVRDQSTE